MYLLMVPYVDELPTLQSVFAEKVASELPLYQGHSSNIEAVLYEAFVDLPEANTTPSYTIIGSLYRRHSTDNRNYVTDVAEVFTYTGRLEVDSQQKKLLEGFIMPLLHSTL